MTCRDGYNNPPADSLFYLSPDRRTNECKVCGRTVGNCTESRDAHLNEYGCHNPSRPASPIPDQGEVT